MGLQVSPFALLNRQNTWTQQQTIDAPTSLVLKNSSNGNELSFVGSGSQQTVMENAAGGLTICGVNGGQPAAFLSVYTNNCTLKSTSSGASTQYGFAPSISNPAVASGTVYQNTTERFLTIYLPVYASVAGTDGTLAVAIGTTSTPSVIVTDRVAGGTSSTATRTFVLRIPPTLYWSVTATGATLGTATQIEE